ncbi:uncharacterized protein PAF06_010017 [Gastrophryne carolinensis]
MESTPSLINPLTSQALLVMATSSEGPLGVIQQPPHYTVPMAMDKTHQMPYLSPAYPLLYPPQDHLNSACPPQLLSLSHQYGHPRPGVGVLGYGALHPFAAFRLPESVERLQAGFLNPKRLKGDSEPPQIHYLPMDTGLEAPHLSPGPVMPPTSHRSSPKLRTSSGLKKEKKAPLSGPLLCPLCHKHLQKEELSLHLQQEMDQLAHLSDSESDMIAEPPPHHSQSPPPGRYSESPSMTSEDGQKLDRHQVFQQVRWNREERLGGATSKLSSSGKVDENYQHFQHLVKTESRSSKVGENNRCSNTWLNQRSRSGKVGENNRCSNTWLNQRSRSGKVGENNRCSDTWLNQRSRSGKVGENNRCSNTWLNQRSRSGKVGENNRCSNTWLNQRSRSGKVGENNRCSNTWLNQRSRSGKVGENNRCSNTWLNQRSRSGKVGENNRCSNTWLNQRSRSGKVGENNRCSNTWLNQRSRSGKVGENNRCSNTRLNQRSRSGKVARVGKCKRMRVNSHEPSRATPVDGEASEEHRWEDDMRSPDKPSSQETDCRGSPGSSVSSPSDESDIDETPSSSRANEESLEMLREKIQELTEKLRNTHTCHICLDAYTVPVASIQCWHIHCEACWLRALGTKKLCPQCNTITSPSDLRRVYL